MDSRWRHVLNSPPIMPERPKLYRISEDVLKEASHSCSYSHVVYLNLHDNAIRNIEVITARRVMYLTGY